MCASHLLNSSCLIQQPAVPHFLLQVRCRWDTIRFSTSISHKVWPEHSLCIDHLGGRGLQGTRKPLKTSSIQLRKRLWIKRGDRWRSALIRSESGQITHPVWVDQVTVSDYRRPLKPCDPGFTTEDVSMWHHIVFEKTAQSAE